jgi:hypothetical protein
LRNGIGNLARHVRRRPCPAASLAGEEAMTDLREAIARAALDAAHDGMDIAEAILAAIETAGWQCVPKEHTPDQWRAGYAVLCDTESVVETGEHWEGRAATDVYRAMLAAAPKPGGEQ